MEREALVTRVIELETKLALHKSQKARTKKENEDLHTMDMYRLWWMEQVLNKRKTS